MEKSDLFTQIIEFLEKDLTLNSNNIRNILNQVKTLQSTYQLELDHFNQNCVEEKIKFFANEISKLIHLQTLLIEVYANVSGYLLIPELDESQKIQRENSLFEQMLSYFTLIENYEMCSIIKGAKDSYNDETTPAGSIGGN
jgi:hypothetical protein